MKKWHLLLINGIALGELFGLVFSLFFSYLYGLNDYVPSAPTFTDHFTRPLNAVLVSVILWGLMGLVFSAGALVFKVNYWTLRKRTIVNFVVYYCGFTPLAILAGWFPLNVTNWLFFTGIFVLVYVLMWMINMYLVKREIKRINQKIKK